MRRTLALALLLVAAPAGAWESTCYTYGNADLEPWQYTSMARSYCYPPAGPRTARERWIGGLDAHRALWERTRELAGLPATVSTNMRLRVFTSSATVEVDGQQLPTLVPAAFQDATRAQSRTVSVGELAQLPDFSFALWDWGTGHESCPLGDATPALSCHDFGSHMGSVNSNHFLPQAHEFFAYYHGLALARAGNCKAMRDRLSAAGGRFDSYAQACELEALALEAVGQHFLHDAWSAGHMWQRWGSPNLSDFPAGDEQRDRAVLVALTSGLIHGARGVLQILPAWTSYDVDDALNAPNDQVRMRWANGASYPAIGDDYLALLPDPSVQGATYSEQSQRLYSCAVSSMLEVYRASGEIHGAASPAKGGLQTLDPLGEDCFGQRVTNASMLVAEALQLKLASLPITVTLDSRLAAWLLPVVSRTNGDAPVSPTLRARFRFDLQRTVSMTRLLAAKSPGGIEAADGRLGQFMGASPNGAYAKNLSGYVDPQLPWPATSSDEPARGRATQLARLDSKKGGPAATPRWRTDRSDWRSAQPCFDRPG